MKVLETKWMLEQWIEEDMEYSEEDCVELTEFLRYYEDVVQLHRRLVLDEESIRNVLPYVYVYVKGILRQIRNMVPRLYNKAMKLFRWYLPRKLQQAEEEYKLKQIEQDMENAIDDIHILNTWPSDDDTDDELEQIGIN